MLSQEEQLRKAVEALKEVQGEVIIKFNPYHDAKGRFTDHPSAHLVITRDRVGSHTTELGMRHKMGSKFPEPKPDKSEDEMRRDAIKDIKAELSKGVHTDQDAIRVGDKVANEVERRLGNSIKKQEAHVESLRNEKDMALKAYYTAVGSSKRGEAYNDFASKNKAYLDAQHSVANLRHAKVAEVLNEIRPLSKTGTTNYMKGSSVEGRKVMTEATKAFPESWISVANEVDLQVKKVDRGYCRGRGVIGLELGGHQERVFSTALHENAHRMQNMYGGSITRLEDSFYKRRTQGEPLRRLSDITGNGNYSSSEVTRVDSWSNPYIGKEYSGRSHQGTEILSMGVEGTFRNAHNMWNKDREHVNFTLGVLAGA